jgi:hypothetical protein
MTAVIEVGLNCEANGDTFGFRWVTREPHLGVIWDFCAQQPVMGYVTEEGLVVCSLS